MRIRLLSFLSSCTALAIASSTFFAVPEKISFAQAEFPKAYQDALNDAADPLLVEVLDHLTVINESNPKIWEAQPGKSRILVVTFTTANGYELGEINLPHKEIWVTVGTELKDFCREYQKTGVDNNKLNERLEQLLGLPPGTGYTHIAEIAVDPKYLKRTTLDPDISKYIRETVGKYTAQPLIQSSLSFPQGVDPAFKTWLTTLVMNRTSSRFPWTGLGYTYDWSPKTNLQNHAGLSEFIIFLTAKDQDLPIPIEVKKVSSSEEYCKTK